MLAVAALVSVHVRLAKVDIGVDLIVYLQTTPETAYERKKARARKEGVNVLQKIGKRHKVPG